MIQVNRKTQTEKFFENLGFLVGAAVFFGILYFVINKLTQSQQITGMILAVIIAGLLMVNQINHKYKKWVW